MVKCKKCGASCNILDQTCSRCGASLCLPDDGPESLLQTDDTDTLLEKTSRLIDRELADMEQEIFGASTAAVAGHPSIVKRFGDLDAPAAGMFLQGGLKTLDTREEEILQIAAFVIKSPHVQTNRLYRQRAEATSLVYLADDPKVNAFATDVRHPEILAKPPMIVFLGGLANATRLASFAMASHAVLDNVESWNLFAAAIQSVGQAIVAGQGTLDTETATAIYAQSGFKELAANEEIIRRTRSYGAAMNMSVIAHELGHIALGHTLSLAWVPDEVSRNQEREADSFCASVAGVSPFSDHTIAGGIFWWVILTWAASAANNETRVTTHPHSRERLMDYIRANQSQAAALGITPESIEELLP
jgi:hypothetical protein